jgi:hypothetical protein
MQRNEELINSVIEQLQMNLQDGDMSSVEDLVRQVPESYLVGYLSDNEPSISEFMQYVVTNNVRGLWSLM